MIAARFLNYKISVMNNKDFSTIIKFPKCAAVDANAAMEQFFALFHDHYPVRVGEDSDYWFIKKIWPKDAGWYIDENVVSAAYRLFNIDNSAIPTFALNEQWEDVTAVLSLIHSRAIVAPAIAQRHGDLVISHIVHVDDHTDMMPSILARQAGSVLLDPINNAFVEITNIESVKDAINCGSINKGNFLSVFIMSLRYAYVYHVRYDKPEMNAEIIIDDESYAFAGSYFTRTNLKLRPTIEIGGNFQYKLASNLPFDLAFKEKAYVWLDVDMDAFCNRFNGDSDNKHKTRSVEEFQETERRIESFLAQLSNTSWLSRIKAVSLAISPGFFPSDYWDWAVSKVWHEMKRIITWSRSSF